VKVRKPQIAFFASFEADRAERVAFSHVDLFAASQNADPPTEFRLWAAGENRTTKGTVLFDALAAVSVQTKVGERGGNDFFVDYGHASLAFLMADPAEAGKAAGWFRPEVRDGSLWATNVSWTEAAAKKIRAREFRYISPAGDIERMPDGRVRFVELYNAALTNDPATIHAPPLVASRTGESRTEEPAMPFWKRLLAMFSLAETTTEEEAVALLSRMREGYASLLTLSGKASPAEALGVFQAWQAGSAQAQQLATEVQQLRTGAGEAERSALIAANTTGAHPKLTPAMAEKWARTVPLAQLKSFLEVAAPVVAPAPKEPGGGTKTLTLSDADRKVAAMCGVKSDDLQKYRETTAAQA
jgi:phage I-like protein